MKRYLIAATAAVLLAVPASAQGRVIELGAGAEPPAASNCPEDPCVAAYQVTAYQMRAGSLKNPFVIPRPGYIVAFTVKLGELTSDQSAFFSDRFGAEPQVQLSILRKSKRKGHRRNHRLLRASEIFDIEPYLGSSPTFVLQAPLRVGKDFRVALTVPTWAPVLDTVDLARTSWWRSSRAEGECGKDDELSPPSAQEEVTSIQAYDCKYRSSRLLYTATYIPDPRETNVKRKKRRRSREARRRAARASAAGARGGSLLSLGGGALIR